MCSARFRSVSLYVWVLAWQHSSVGWVVPGETTTEAHAFATIFENARGSVQASPRTSPHSKTERCCVRKCVVILSRFGPRWLGIASAPHVTDSAAVYWRIFAKGSELQHFSPRVIYRLRHKERHRCCCLLSEPCVKVDHELMLRRNLIRWKSITRVFGRLTYAMWTWSS